LPVIHCGASGFYFNDQQLTTLAGDEVEFKRFAAEVGSQDLKAALRKPG